MKKFYVLKTMMAVMLAMLLTVGNVFAEKGWVKVTHTTTLSVGDSIIIAAANYDKAIGTTQNNNNRAAVNITKVGDQATFTTGVQVFVLQQSSINGAFVLFDPDASGGYLNAPGGGNFMRTATTLPTNGSGDWMITVFNNDSITIVAQNSDITQVYMRYNSGSSLFSCYASGSSVVNAVTIYRYEEVEAATVATPAFTPSEGTYYEPQQVSITCATAGATILYTINGDNPTANGLVYSTPLSISTTTTVKAVAFLGTDTSFVNQATYTFPTEVADIAAFKAASTTTNATPYHVMSDLTFVFRSGAYMYVKDASAGLLIYDNTVITSEYDEGDVISGGVYGTYTKYNQQVEMIPLLNTAASTQNTGSVQPVVVTMADLLANYNNYDAQLVTLENVTFPDGFSGNANTTITQGESHMTLRKQFNAIPLDTTLAAGTVTNVTGLVGKYNTTIQLYPRGNFDLSAAPQPAQPSMTVTLNGNQFSTLDTLQVSFDIQNFTLGTDGMLKLEGELLTTLGATNPMFIPSEQVLNAFLAQTFSPLPAGTHTVTASLVDMTMAALTPAVSQTVTFTVTAPVAESPVFSPESGTYSDSVVITMTCATPGAEIHYTIDGTVPTATSTIYVNPFTLTEDATVKAKAFMNNVSWEDSPVAEAIYTIVTEPTLTVAPVSLTFSSTQLTSTVGINSASLTAPIVISCDNTHFALSETSFPANVGNTSFTVTYDGQVPATGTVTVTSGSLSAQVALVATTQLPAPVFAPADGTTDTLITVAMSSTETGAIIYYTTDNSEPTTASNTYSEPITLNTPGVYTYKAIAVKDGWENSNITTATYTVVAPVVPSIDTIMYSTGFEAEEGFAASTTYNNVNVAYTGEEGQQWGTVYGTPATNDHICGAQSMQMRWYLSAPSTMGYTFTNFDIRNVTYVTFDAKSPNGLKLNVSYSIDGGNTYMGDSLYTIATGGRHNYRFNVSETGEYNFVRLKFAVVLPETAPSGTSKLLIDSVVVFGVPGVVVNVVETPVIAPNGGTYYEAFDATITCATADAVIRYTTDGTEPTETSTVYTAPVTINATTTLKAKAWKTGMEASLMAAATYNFPPEVANIAAFKAANTVTNNTVYKITGDVNYVFRSGRYMFVEDASAALLIFDNSTPVITTTYNEGDVISGGVFGSYTLYNGMAEMVPARNTAEATGTPVTITPMVATIPTLVAQYSTLESRLVTIENVTFIGNKKYVNGTDTLQYYDRFASITNEPEVGETGSITGFLANYNGQVQLYPRDDNDFTTQTMEQVATPVITPASGTYEGSVEVSISCATEGAIIYYTMDGTDPDENSGDYGGSFVIAATSVRAAPVTVKAIAMKEGMTNSEVATATYDITTGISDMKQNVSIYPNPTDGNVTLDLSGLNARTVELFSVNGQLLYSVVPTENVMTMSLSDYAAGVYFVRIHSDKAVTTQKIVKK
ncbi:MAG: hypothetical protein CW341_04615 [Bacteroidetes bacterium]|nr:hypothetical protein [Bacteroidota bacterium]